MFLKSLVLKGFKSFADRTTLEFEPGVTVVVGPNGSGKSNLVDAVAWVLGAQGPRTVRGGKMDDVIFAGTPQRQALGRAEVSLVIDNSAGLLPIDFSEVEITRTLFRDGESEYAINGAPCRLLDIQELLSDTGVGRHQHVIVGQGQVDAVLNATPEARRAIVEEAAGILKYRKRKEKAERRLEATEGNLLRLQDLLREVRRQLRPLERQADAARRHDAVEAELRGIRLYLLGREIEELRTTLRDRAHRRRVDGERERSVRDELARLDDAVAAAERVVGGIGDDDLDDGMVRVEALRERSRGLLALVAEKRRGLERARHAAAGAQSELRAIEQAVARATDELDRLAARRQVLAARRAELDGELAGLRDDAGGAAGDEPRLRETLEAARAAREIAEARVAEADEARRGIDAEVHRWRARAEALALALDEARRAAGADRLEGLDGVVGALVDLIEIDEGAEAAVAAALGDAMRALVVRDVAGARRAIDRLSHGDAQGLLLVMEGSDHAVQGRLAPPGARPLVELVHARADGLDAVLEALLDGVVYVEAGWQDALDLALAHPTLTVTTPAGERFRVGDTWRAGSGASDGATRAALDEARRRAAEAESAQREADEALREARQEFRSWLDEEQRCTRAHDACVARAAASAEALRRVEAEAARLAEEDGALAAQVEELTERRARDGAHLEEIRRAVPEVSAPAHTADPEAVRAGNLARLERALRAHLDAVEALHARMDGSRRRRLEARRAALGRLETLRAERAAHERELEEVRERLRRMEIEDAEATMRLEAAVETVRREFDVEPEVAMAAPEPEVAEGTTLTVRAHQLERELRLMGPVNPLALEEYEALQARHQFLESQLEDVRQSRRELHKVIRAIDAEIATVFAAAFADVERHFSDLFHRLFPGGSGRIRLTEADDELSAGVEIEARPSGKNVRRLSLLSGGERSLVALAFLFAVFRARPSPFYLLDEVEAALDDVNLHRFLDLLAEFRDEAQLMVVTHQKRTMEAADVLYGVSMPPGGSSRVVSERLREEHGETVVLP